MSSSAIQTFTGLRFSPLEPDPAAIAIEDIAHGLANLCRFGGHCAVFYSVANHSCVVADAVGGDRETALHALLHDASEAYLGDLPHPVKHRSDFGRLYREIEEPLQAAILARFGLGPTPPPVVKEVDRAALAAERALLMRVADDAWWPELDGVEPLDVEIVPWSPQQSETEFLRRFEALR